MRTHPTVALVVVGAITVLAAVFVYPGGPVGNWRPWRLGLDLLGGSHLEYDVDLAQVAPQDRESVLEGLRDVIERRVNLFGVSEPQVFIAESDRGPRLVAELAGVLDIAEAIRQIGETPFLEFRETVESATGTITGFLATELTGRYVTGARLDFDSVTRAPEVAVTFNEEGARIFEELTGRLVGEPLAILLDGVPISIPVVQQKISGGSAVITGDFTVPEARELVGRFNAGALPAPITLVAQQTVSATLGSDLLEKAVIAGAWGTLLVMAFMVVYYRMLGVFASLALIIYIPLTLAVFKLVPVTMTLAGVAGFVLTVGMAVDANILIFERMKEEMRKGLSRASAIEEGFRRAWLSIRDSNVTTALTALILYYFTSSFIQGFALTLFLGVLVSMFSALTVTRTLLRVFTRKV